MAQKIKNINEITTLKLEMELNKIDKLEESKKNNLGSKYNQKFFVKIL